ncbi:MAG: ABC transporter permease [Methylohalobius sp.]|nr:ABC transporter permease [Methylohalobius sp.]
MSRLVALIRKEFLQIARDPGSYATAFVLPLVLLLLFGYGVSLDARRVPLALVAEQLDSTVQDLLSGFYHSEYFVPISMPTMAQAQTWLLRGQVQGIVHLRLDFTRRLKNGQEAQVQLIVNGIDANTARLVEGYVSGVVETWWKRSLRKRLATPRVEVEARIWFNPEAKSRNFLVPGLIAVIMTLIGALLTSLVIAREWERGTLEALLATEVLSGEWVLAKLIAYFLLGNGGWGLAVAMAMGLFDVPLRGSIWLLWVSSALFLLVALGIGLLISSLSKNQFVAAQIALIVTYLPAFLLSGFLFDIASMPKMIQLLTYLMPARYYVTVLQTLFLAGDVWSLLWPNLFVLLALAILFLGLTFKCSPKRLA